MSPYADNFWPEEIKSKIQSPFAILKRRADELTQRTRGVLIGRVSTLADKSSEYVSHRLEVEVPALKSFRHRLLTVKHHKDMFYPSIMDSIYFNSMLREFFQTIDKPSRKPRSIPAIRENEVSSDQELDSLLKKVVNANPIKSTLVSLIVQANEAVEQSDKDALSKQTGKREAEEIDIEESEEIEQDL